MFVVAWQAAWVSPGRIATRIHRRHSIESECLRHTDDNIINTNT